MINNYEIKINSKIGKISASTSDDDNYEIIDKIK